MKTVEILKQVLFKGQWVKPLAKGGPVVSVPDATANHWIATGAARLPDTAPPKPAEKKA